MQHDVKLAALSLVLATLLGTPAVAQQPVARGKQIVEAMCGRCHATGKTGTSPLAQAPALRTLSQKYPLRHLEEALAEGIVTGHNDMPVFRFSPGEIDAILAYLTSISVR